MSPHEQTQPQDAPEDTSAKTSDASKLRFVLRVAAKTLAVLCALALLPLWFYLSSVVEVTLDYPTRLAGWDSRYPARGTFAFWWLCLVETSKGALFFYLFGGLPTIIVICFCFCYGFSIRNGLARLIIALVLASGPFIFGYLYIRSYISSHRLEVFWESLVKVLQG